MSDITKFYEAASKDAGLQDGLQTAEKQYFEAIKAIAEKAGFRITPNDFKELLKETKVSSQAAATDKWCVGPDYSCYAAYI
jgi:hypothetical protein